MADQAPGRAPLAGALWSPGHDRAGSDYRLHLPAAPTAAAALAAWHRPVRPRAQAASPVLLVFGCSLRRCPRRTSRSCAAGSRARRGRASARSGAWGRPCSSSTAGSRRTTWCRGRRGSSSRRSAWAHWLGEVETEVPLVGPPLEQERAGRCALRLGRGQATDGQDLADGVRVVTEGRLVSDPTLRRTGLREPAVEPRDQVHAAEVRRVGSGGLRQHEESSPVLPA